MPPPREDVVRAAARALGDGEPRTVDEICWHLRAHGWSVQPEHLRAMLLRADRAFLRIAERFALRPGQDDLPSAPQRTWGEVEDELVAHLADHRWQELVVRAAYPPPLEPQHTDLGRRMEEERRSRAFHVVKLHDDRHCWLVAWTGEVTLTRREALRSWACWTVDGLARWEPGVDPVHLRYHGLPPSDVVLTRHAADGRGLAEALVAELVRSGAEPWDAWVEMVQLPVEQQRERARLLEQSTAAPAVPSRGRHAAPSTCRSCSGPLADAEARARGAHDACWASEEPAESEVVRFTRREWVGAMDRRTWAALVHAGVSGHVHGPACEEATAPVAV